MSMFLSSGKQELRMADIYYSITEDPLSIKAHHQLRLLVGNNTWAQKNAAALLSATCSSCSVTLAEWVWTFST